MKKTLLLLFISSSHLCFTQTFSSYELTDNLFRIEFCEAMQMDEDDEPEIVVVTPQDRKLTVYDYENGQYARTVLAYNFQHGCFGFADMDDDGDDDLMAISPSSNFNSTAIVWLEFNANNELIEHSVVDLIGATGTLKYLDFDLDGIKDILFSSESTLHLLLGNTQFLTEITTPCAYSTSQMSVFTDLNEDGYIDITGQSENGSFLLKGVTSFGFEEIPFDYTSLQFQSADMNADGLPELIYMVNGSFQILTNLGGFEFQFWNKPPELISSFHLVKIVDFDADNDLDILSFEASEDKLQFIEMDGLTFVQKSTIIESNALHTIAVVSDCDLDGDLDLIVSDYNRYQLNYLALENYQCPAYTQLNKAFWQPIAFAATELDNQPGTDLVFTDEMDFKTHYLRNITSNPDDFEYEVIDLNLWNLSYDLIVNDWNNDGVNDLVTSAGYDTIVYLTGFDTGNITSEFIVDVPGSAYRISGIADFDNNGFDDILYGYNTSNIAWNNNGVFTHTEILDTYHPFDIADFDNDGWPDIAFSKWYVDYQVKTIVWNNAGNFDSESEIGHGISNESLNSYDVNQDGLLDVVYIDADGSNLAFNLNNGDRTFALAIINNEFELPEFAYGRIKFADLNGDGRKDVLVDANPWVYYHQLEDFSYSFADTMQWPMNYLPGMFYPITTVDVNGDQFDDIITTSWHSSILWCLTNNGDFESKVPETASTSGEIEVFPNPSFDHLTLSIPNSLNFANSIQIFDASGRDCSSLIQVNNNASADKIDLDVRGLASGLYQVVVQSGDPNKSPAVATIVKQ